MEEHKVIQVKQSVLADNDSDTNKLCIQLKKQRIFLLNLMPSPGSRKATTLKATIEKPIDFLRLIKNSTS
jgi:hydrogenase nickel incorporation protein HypB